MFAGTLNCFGGTKYCPWEDIVTCLLGIKREKLN